MQLKNLVANFFKLFNLRKVSLPTKRVKESGASFRKKKKAREEEMKKNKGAILKFVNISLQCSLSLANERDEVSSFSKFLPHEETEKTVELEQSKGPFPLRAWKRAFFVSFIDLSALKTEPSAKQSKKHQ